MNQVVRGIFNGTAAAVKIGIGFIPKRVTLFNVTENTAFYQIGEWLEGMRMDLEKVEGLTIEVADAAASSDELGHGLGITPYLGGDVADGTETYLMLDRNPDKRDSGTLGTVNQWNLDTPGNRTGHVNAGVSTTVPNKVGVGSKIVIDPGPGGPQLDAYIQVLTNDGDAADEITLNRAVPTGRILFLGGIHTFVQVPSGLKVSQGFQLPSQAELNANDEIMVFEAWD